MAQTGAIARKTGGGWLVVAGQLLLMAALTAGVLPLITPGAAVKGDALVKVLFLGRMVLVIAAATVFLRLRGLRWSDVGLSKPKAGRFFLALGLGFVLAVAFSYGARWLLVRAGYHATADYSMFAPLHANPPLYLYFLIPVTWGTAAFGEEMLFRGFVLDAIRRLLVVEGWPATLLAIGLQAALFGSLHLYQDPAGAVSAGSIGLALGLAWWIGGRNLWAGIVIHGIVDSMAMTALYLGAVAPHP